MRERLTKAERDQLLGRDRERIAGALNDRIEQDIFTIGVRLTALLEDQSLDHRVAGQLRGLRQLSIGVADEVRRAIFALTSQASTCNSRWAPRGVLRICCFLTMRLLMT